MSCLQKVEFQHDQTHCAALRTKGEQQRGLLCDRCRVLAVVDTSEREILHVFMYDVEDFAMAQQNLKGSQVTDCIAGRLTERRTTFRFNYQKEPKDLDSTPGQRLSQEPKGGRMFRTTNSD